MQVRKDTAKMQAKRYELIQPMHRLFLPEAWTPIHLDAPNEFYKVKPKPVLNGAEEHPRPAKAAVGRPPRTPAASPELATLH